MHASPAVPFRKLLRIPLFYKILIANAVIVMTGAVVGGSVTAQYVRADSGNLALHLIVPLTLIGVALSVAVNALILRIALRPLKQLEETAARVQGGDVTARAPVSPLADRELERLQLTFNGMLETLAAYRERLREIAARALTAEEEERKRIAHELHDETAQTLAALLIRLRLLRTAQSEAARNSMIDELRKDLGDALEGVRRFAQGLRPPALDELGLVPALEAHVRALAESTGLPIRLEAETAEAALSLEAELALYRIVQEALTNAVRHGGATRIVVRIQTDAGGVEAEVNDDGRGFRVETVLNRRDGGLGLFGMQERASYVGGSVRIRSEPGRGTAILAQIPAEHRPTPSALP